MNSSSLSPLELIIPAASPSSCSDVELLGAIVWLAIHADNKKHLPLENLQQWVLPAIRSGQLALAYQVQDGLKKPVACMTWANFSAQAEAIYVDNPDQDITPEHWVSGDRMWIIDWIAPFGHNAFFSAQLKHALHNVCARSLYHKGGQQGLRIMRFRGNSITPVQEHAWWNVRPILTFSSALQSTLVPNQQTLER